MSRFDRKAKKGKLAGPARPVETPPQQQTPIFCLHYLKGDYCLSACEQSEKAAFAEKLHQLSKLTWAEICQAHRHGMGFEKITRDQLRCSIPPHISTDVNILAFRFCGKAPMLGYRDGRTFHVLALDRNFTAYPH